MLIRRIQTVAARVDRLLFDVNTGGVSTEDYT